MRIALSIIVSILITSPFQAVSQKYRNKEVSLISFNISIHPDTKKYIDQFESHFQAVKNVNADKIISKIKEQAWGSLVDSLQQEIGMVILPISTFGSKIGYDAYNFPDVNISKAQRIGYSKFYLKIDLGIGPEVITNQSFKSKNDSTLQKQKLKEGEIKPVVTLTITCYPANGIIPVGKYVGSAQASTIWSSESPSILDGLVNTNSKTDMSTLMSLINEAIFDATINMQIK
ncbi:MAG: hypothetical protein EHM93_16060 [Bacteroidales bacterium]|nr:MAG: hypothetical protein EHM93_16060 [Bacteroidales bacterium]